MSDKPEKDKAGAEEGAAPAKGGIKALLPLIITIVLMPALAWAMTTFVLLPKLQKSLGGGAATEEHAEAEEGGHGEAEAKGGHGEAKSEAKGEAKGGHGEAKDGKEAKGGHGAAKGGAKQTVVMSKLLVNVAGTLGSRYLLASLTLSGKDSEFKSKVEQNEPQLRDMAQTAMSSKTITDLEKPGARNLLRSELLTGFNNILGGNLVQEIFITEFAIQ